MLHQTPQRKTHSHSQSEAKEGNIILLFHLFFFLHLSIPFHFKSNLRTNSIPPWSQFFLFPPPSRLSPLALAHHAPETPIPRGGDASRLLLLTHNITTPPSSPLPLLLLLIAIAADQIPNPRSGQTPPPPPPGTSDPGPDPPPPPRSAVYAPSPARKP